MSFLKQLTQFNPIQLSTIRYANINNKVRSEVDNVMTTVETRVHDTAKNAIETFVNQSGTGYEINQHFLGTEC